MNSGPSSRKRKDCDMDMGSKKRKKYDGEEVLKSRMRDPFFRMRLISLTLPGIVVSNNIGLIKAISENFVLDKETFERGMMAALLNSNDAIAEIIWDNFRKKASSEKEIKKARKELIQKLSMIVSSELIFERLNRLPASRLVVNEPSHLYSMEDLIDALLGITLEEKEVFNEQDLERAVLDSANVLINYKGSMKKELLGENEEEKMEVEVDVSRLVL